MYPAISRLQAAAVMPTWCPTALLARVHTSAWLPVAPELHLFPVPLVQLLAGKLLELPRETFTQETYIQLYQAKMSLSQQVCWLFVRLGAGGCECAYVHGGWALVSSLSGASASAQHPSHHMILSCPGCIASLCHRCTLWRP